MLIDSCISCLQNHTWKKFSGHFQALIHYFHSKFKMKIRLKRKVSASVSHFPLLFKRNLKGDPCFLINISTISASHFTLAN